MGSGIRLPGPSPAAPRVCSDRKLTHHGTGAAAERARWGVWAPQTSSSGPVAHGRLESLEFPGAVWRGQTVERPCAGSSEEHGPSVPWSDDSQDRMYLEATVCFSLCRGEEVARCTWKVPGCMVGLSKLAKPVMQAVRICSWSRVEGGEEELGQHSLVMWGLRTMPRHPRNKTKYCWRLRGGLALGS